MAAEVQWYRANGKFTAPYPKGRIARDRDGVAYVIGDWAWNRGNRPREVIERDMAYSRLVARRLPATP